MKHRFFILSLIIAASALAAAARNRVTFEGRLAWDITCPSGQTDVYSNGSGFEAGAVAAVPLWKGLYFEPGLSYFFNTFGMNYVVDAEGLYDTSVRMHGLRVPLNVGYRFRLLDNLSLAVTTGPSVNINLSAREYFTAGQMPEPGIHPADMFKRGFKRVDAQWNFGLKFTFAHHYTVGLAGGVGFTPLAKFGNHDNKVRVRNNTVAVSLGYIF